MKLRISILCFLLSAFTSNAATWRVSTAASGANNGTSWTDAWENTTDIVWASVSAGDTIYLDGGASGLSYAAITGVTANGAADNYITIKRSTESGRDGIVTIATATTFDANYIKFDGVGYKHNGTKYVCGIVFNCTSANTLSNMTGSVNITGERPWFRYCYFAGDYDGGYGHSLSVPNQTGFVLERCWFYQSYYEDQWVFRRYSGAGSCSVAITNTVFQDSNKPDRADDDHRDVANPWEGIGGWDLYLVGCMMFNTAGHASDQPQGDGILLQVPDTMGVVYAVNNFCGIEYARFIAFGSDNDGHVGFYAYNNTIIGTTYNSSFGITAAAPATGVTQNNNINDSTATPNFINASSPLGADGIPFTSDDGFMIQTGSTAIDAGASVGVTTDIRGYARTGTPDKGAYEFGATGGTSANTVTVINLFLR